MMYIPEQFAENDIEKITALIKDYPFGMLITSQKNLPNISHLPFLFEKSVAGHGKLIGHMAKDNPQWKTLSDNESVLVVFNAAHGYISPTLYSTPGVPTWNYAVAHLQGNLSVIQDPTGVENILDKLTTQFEAKQQSPWQMSFPIDKNKLLNMIVGFEIEIQSIDAKFKLSQNRTVEEQQNIISQLGNSNHTEAIELSKFMQSYYS